MLKVIDIVHSHEADFAFPTTTIDGIDGIDGIIADGLKETGNKEA